MGDSEFNSHLPDARAIRSGPVGRVATPEQISGYRLELGNVS